MTSIRSNNLLWELSIPGRVESSFLYGTIHLPELSLFGKIPQVQACIDRTRAFMAEFPLDEMAEGEMDAYHLKNGENWSDWLSRKQYESLRKKILKSFRIDVDQFNQLLPMVFEQMIQEQLIEDHAGQSMDFLLWHHAKSKGKILLGAETMKSQLNILTKFPFDMQIKNLRGIARNPANYRSKINKAKNAYINQDIRLLYQQSTKSLGKMRRVLVYDRNWKIACSMVKTMEQMSLTCAVGAGHLSGQKGVLRYLKMQGIRVKPYRS